MVPTANGEQADTMIRTTLIAWVLLSVPVSLFLGRLCRGTRPTAPGWRPAEAPAAAAAASR